MQNIENKNIQNLQNNQYMQNMPMQKTPIQANLPPVKICYIINIKYLIV
jgi:hypothetical protein